MNQHEKLWYSLCDRVAWNNVELVKDQLKICGGSILFDDDCLIASAIENDHVDIYIMF